MKCRLSFLFVLFSLCLCSLETSFATRKKRGICGSTLPPWGVRPRGKGRYKVGASSLDGLLKFYRKVYGSNGRYVKVTQLLSLPHVATYHIKSLRSRTRWAGYNLTHFKRSDTFEVFVICKNQRPAY